MTLNLPAPGNWSEVWISNSDGRSYTSTTCRSPIIGTLRKSSRTQLSVLNTNVLVCGLYVDYDESRHSSWTKLRRTFGCVQEHQLRGTSESTHITQKLILNHQAEILNVTTIDWTSPSWTRSALTHDQVITWTKAKVRVYSDSVL